ncbi:MAG: Zn-dependent hydrolase, partial [Pseudomonas sp.]|nr:Zn-dependent hydrolase [Pseudomonas sp.]
MNTRIDPSQHLLGQGALVSRERLWQSLMDLARLGATQKGGVCRLALTDLDPQARDLF